MRLFSVFCLIMFSMGCARPHAAPSTNCPAPVQATVADSEESPAESELADSDEEKAPCAPCKGIQPQSVIAVATIDFNEDGRMDRALLLLPEAGSDDQGAELTILLSDPKATSDNELSSMTLAFRRRNFVWLGFAWGTMPELKTRSSSVLEVISQNEGFGRGRWYQMLTVTYRNGAFEVDKLARAERDTLDLKVHSQCDIDFLTGEMVRNKHSSIVPAKAIPLADWADDVGTGFCAGP